MRTELRPAKVQQSALFLAWLIALASTLGALFIGEVMERTPCILCWYQRIAMFPLAIILGIAAYSSDKAVTRYVLPIAAIGGLVAVWHTLLFAGIVPEAVQPCTQGGPSCTDDEQIIFGMPLPFLSSAAFAAIVLLLTVPFRKGTK